MLTESSLPNVNSAALPNSEPGQLLLLGELEFKGLNARLEEPLPFCPYRLVKPGRMPCPLRM